MSTSTISSGFRTAEAFFVLAQQHGKPTCINKYTKPREQSRINSRGNDGDGQGGYIRYTIGDGGGRDGYITQRLTQNNSNNFFKTTATTLYMANKMERNKHATSDNDRTMERPGTERDVAKFSTSGLKNLIKANGLSLAWLALHAIPPPRPKRFLAYATGPPPGYGCVSHILGQHSRRT